jgi:hypothetical protein
MAERFMMVANKKSASPTWIDDRPAIFTFDRVGLQGLVRDRKARQSIGRRDQTPTQTSV